MTMRKLAGIAAVLLVALMVAAPAAQARPQPLATCFWEGPISTKQPSTRGFDGRNFNFPEESATYWLARFRLPEGGKLTLRGRFGHARYQSLNAYSDGAPTDGLADFQVVPDPGSTNPFITGQRRDRRRRSYAIDVVNEAPPADAAARRPNTVYAKPQQPNSPIELLYRVYEPDRGRDLTGGTGLPAPSLPCSQVNDPNREIPVQSVPAPTWQALVHSPGCNPDTNPAYDPVRWERFFNLNYATEAVSTDCTDIGFQLRRKEPAPQQGGFYSNRDNAYIYSHLSRRFGPVLVLSAKLPTVPRTRQGQRRLGRAQLRFWSLCTGESRVTTRTPDCLADRQVPVNAARDFTVVVSRAEDRPANATPACGAAWLDWGERGDAAGRPDYGLLIMRNMLPDPSFAEAIQRVSKPGDEPAVMGAYFPRTAYMDKASYEGRGCSRSRIVLGRGLRVRCVTTEASCTGVVRLTRHGRRLGAGRFSVRAGHSAKVRVRLNRAGRRARKAHRRVLATARASTPAEVPLRARRRIRLR